MGHNSKIGYPYLPAREPWRGRLCMVGTPKRAWRTLADDPGGGRQSRPPSPCQSRLPAESSAVDPGPSPPAPGSPAVPARVARHVRHQSRLLAQGHPPCPLESSTVPAPVFFAAVPVVRCPPSRVARRPRQPDPPSPPQGRPPSPQSPPTLATPKTSWWTWRTTLAGDLLVNDSDGGESNNSLADNSGGDGGRPCPERRTTLAGTWRTTLPGGGRLWRDLPGYSKNPGADGGGRLCQRLVDDVCGGTPTNSHGRDAT